MALTCSVLDADLIAARLEQRPSDDPFAQVVEHDNDRAWRVVLESCRAGDGRARTVLSAARDLGAEGMDGESGGPGMTLVVMLGANNPLGPVVHLQARWTPADYLAATPRRRVATKGA